MVPVDGSSTGKLMLVSDDIDLSSLEAVPREPGARGWSTDTGRAAKVAVAGEIVYSRDRFLLEAFDANAPLELCHNWCDPMWQGTISGTGTDSAPVVAGDVVYVGSTDAVDAFDAAGCGSFTCAPLVTVPVDGAVTNLSLSQGRLFVTSASTNGATLTAFAPSL